MTSLINENVVEGKWKQLKGQMKQKWGELTDDELDRARGNREELVGIIQERYGKTQEAAEREVSQFVGAWKSTNT